MSIDRYDVMATAATALAGAVYWAHTADVALLESARPAAVGVLAAGVAACAANGSRPGGPIRGTYANLMTFFAAVAAVLAIATVVTGAEESLVALTLLTGGLWLVSTARHLLVAEPPVMEPPLVEHIEPRVLVGKH